MPTIDAPAMTTVARATMSRARFIGARSVVIGCPLSIRIGKSGATREHKDRKRMLRHDLLRHSGSFRFVLFAFSAFLFSGARGPNLFVQLAQPHVFQRRID